MLFSTEPKSLGCPVWHGFLGLNLTKKMFEDLMNSAMSLFKKISLTQSV